MLGTYLIAGNALEPCTTIAEKSRYDSLKTQGLAVHAGKHPNVKTRMNLQRLSPCRAVVTAIGVRHNRKGVGENPLNGKGTPLT